MNHDPADLDGDGEFDAIDIVILEEGQDSSPPPINRKIGCCWVVMVTGAAFAGAGFTISKLMS